MTTPIARSYNLSWKEHQIPGRHSSTCNSWTQSLNSGMQLNTMRKFSSTFLCQPPPQHHFQIRHIPTTASHLGMPTSISLDRLKIWIKHYFQRMTEAYPLREFPSLLGHGYIAIITAEDTWMMSPARDKAKHV